MYPSCGLNSVHFVIPYAHDIVLDHVEDLIGPFGRFGRGRHESRAIMMIARVTIDVSAD